MKPAKLYPCLFTFCSLLFTFLLFLLPLAQHRRSIGRLLQLAHEALDVVEAVVEDSLRRGENQFVMMFSYEIQPEVSEKTQR